jgi:hypothetical protein
VDRTESKANKKTPGKTKFIYLPVGPVGDKTQVRKRLLWAPDFAFHSATIDDCLPLQKIYNNKTFW